MLQFANPALLFGALLLAVPLIIHLLNRRRNKRRPWAAMEFLLKAYRKQRRRLRRENLLLLLLRCLIPILLALAIARPSLRNAASLGASVGAVHHIFVFDRSYSMGLQLPGDTTPFERAKQLATLMVDGLTRRSSGQKVTIILNGLRATIPLRDDLNLNRVKDRIAGLGNPLDTATDLTGALTEAADLVEDGDDTNARVYLLTDMQVRGFGSDPFEDEAQGTAAAAANPNRSASGEGGTNTEGGPDADMFRDTARDAIRRIQEAASLTVLDVRSGSVLDAAAEENVQVVDVGLAVPHAITRAAIPVRARLLNRSSVTKTIQATLEIDASQPQRQSVEIEAGAEGEVTFLVTFRETGQRRVRVEIASGDGLAVDDERALVVMVRERLSVLLVDGSDDSEPDLRDATHLRRILDPTGGEGDPSLAPFSVRTTDTIRLLSDRETLDEDVIVLANVPSLNERAAEKLRNAVRNGAGLFVMLGDRVDPASYNLHLHGAGDGIMPLQLLDAQGFAPGGDRSYGLEVTEPDDLVFADFAEPVYFQIFESLPIYRFISATFVPPAADAASEREGERAPNDRMSTSARVLATVRNPARSPLLVTREFGFGKAAFLTSSISRRPDRWNGLDYEVTAFPLLHQLVHWLALPAIDPFNVQVGASLSATTEKRPLDLAAVLPERAGLSKVPIGEDPQPLMGGRYALPPFTQTASAGFYTIEYMLDLGGGQQREQQVFAVRPEVDEGDLRYYSHAAARNQLGIESISTDLPGDGEAAIQAGISELGPLFLWLTLGCVLAEAALARWVSGRRA